MMDGALCVTSGSPRGGRVQDVTLCDSASVRFPAVLERVLS